MGNLSCPDNATGIKLTKKELIHRVSIIPNKCIESKFDELLLESYVTIIYAHNMIT